MTKFAVLFSSVALALAAQAAFAATLDLGVGESQWVGDTLVRCGGGGGSSSTPRTYCECRPDENYNNSVHIPDYAYQIYRITEYPDGRRNEVLVAQNDFIGGDLCQRNISNYSSCN